jgi:hypothetical protein
MVQAGRVVAKVEWHPGELYRRVGFIMTNMMRPAERAVAFQNHRGTAGQWIKGGKNAVTWTRLSCHRFAANAVRLQLHAPAHNLTNFLRVLAKASSRCPTNWPRSTWTKCCGGSRTHLAAPTTESGPRRNRGPPFRRRQL